MAGEIEATAVAATARLVEMKVAYEASPQRRIERDREQLAGLESDPFHVNAALTNESARANVLAIKSRLAVAEAEVEASVVSQVLTNEQIIDLAIKGEEFRGPISTAGEQIPSSDFAGVIRDDIALGIPERLVRSYHLTGLSDDKLGHIDGQAWLDRFGSDAEMQRLHAAGDPLITMRHRAASYYVAGKHPNISREEEMARRAQLRAWGW
jgi:hypothetical protein